MAEKKLGIEVETKLTGDGLEKAARQTDELTRAQKRLADVLDDQIPELRQNQQELGELEQKLEQLDQTADRAASELNQLGQQTEETRGELGQLEQRSEQTVDSLEDVGDQARQTGDQIEGLGEKNEELVRSYYNLNDRTQQAIGVMGHAADNMDIVGDGLRGIIQETRQGAKEWNDYIKPYSNLIHTINSGRYHTEHLLRWLTGTQRESRYARVEMGEFAEQLQRAGNQSGQLGDELQQVRGDITGLSSSIDTLREAVRELTRHMDKTDQGVDALGNQMVEGGDKAYYMVEALFDSTFALNKVETSSRQTASQLNNVQQELDQTETEARSLSAELNDVRRSVDRVGDEFEELSRKNQLAQNHLRDTELTIGTLTNTLGNVLGNALEEIGQRTVQFVQESVQQFETYETGIREIYTLLPGMSAEAKEQLSADAQELGVELNRLPEEVLPAIYQALSSGVPEENVIETVRISSEAARAGVAELDDTLKLGLAVMNSHVKGVNSLEDVYDVLFHTVKEGVVTLPELNGVLSQVTSVAGEAGVSLQDIGAALITMTKQGDSAEEAAELLSIMLTQLSTSGTTLATVFEQAAGKSFRQFAAEGGTLAEAMGLLQEHANNTGQALGDILGGGSPFFRDTQAARAALELTGARLADLQEAAAGMTEATGSMREAADEFTGSQALARQEAEATTAVFKKELGEALAPMTQAFYETKTAAAEYLIARLAISQAHEDGHLSGIEAYKMQLQLAYTGMSAAEAQRELAEAIEEKNAAQEDSAASGEDTIEQLALSSESAEEFIEKLKDVDAAYAAQTENAIAYWEAVQQHAAETAQAAAEVADSFGQGSKAIVDQYGEVVYASQKYVEQATVEGVTESALADRYTLTAEQRQMVIAAEVDAQTAWARSVELKQQLLDADLEGAAVAEDRARRIAEAAEAEAVALQQSQAQFGQYVLNAAYAKDSTINWTEELFQSATQQGINTTQIGLLAAATGEYSEEQIQAMLTEAAMRQAVEELGAALANKKITVQEALDQLVEFKEQLANPETAELDYSDFEEAKTAAEEAKIAMLALEGDYSATFTTNYTETGTPPTSGGSQTPGGSGQLPPPLFYGGKTKPGQAYLVGDDRGRPTPFSEIFVPDVPGTVIGVNDTTELLRNQGEPTESYGYTSYGNFSQPAAQGQQQPGYIDQRKTIIHNHSAEAAALTMASVQVPKRARRNAWMGL